MYNYKTKVMSVITIINIVIDSNTNTLRHW
jgi:hypothetical protein